MDAEDALGRLNAALQGRYRLDRMLGEGGMSRVYEAEDVRHARRVAVKVLRPELAAALGADRFLREIRTTAGLRHPHILPLYDSGHEDGFLFYVMPLVEGRSLRELIEEERRLGIDDALRLLREVADGLRHAHARGVVHRDIKPDNILLDGGRAVITDFGIAHAVSESGGERLTYTGAIIGTPLYLSPEQANGAPVDSRSDLYSLACVAYEMLTGAPPFSGPSPFVVIARHALETPPPMRTVRAEVPPTVAAAIGKALAKAPEDRFATVDEMLEALTSSDPLAGSDVGFAGGDDLDFAAPDKPSVAILPFRSLGADPGREFLGDGIRLGIQSTLVQLSGLFLVNVPTLNAYRDADVSAETVGRELSVRYVLEGTTQQAGQRVRITVQLTDVQDLRVVWAEHYDRDLNNVFELQDEITREVISSVNLKLRSGDVERGWVGKVASPTSHEAFYRGLSHFYQGTPDDNEIARRMFEELHRLEPDSVLGPSYIAVAHWMDAFQGWTDTPEASLEKAAEWAGKAVEYEDNNGLGHTVLGHLRMLEGDFDQAVEIGMEGVRLRSSCPLAHGLLGLVLHYSGDPEAAVRKVREALRLERVYPVWLLSVLAASYRDAGLTRRSISVANESLRLDPDETDALAVLCSDYQMAGKPQQAKGAADELVRRDPSFRLSTYADSQPYRDRETLERVLASLREAGVPD